MYELIKKPILTEKTSLFSSEESDVRVYVFEVALKATKTELKEAVEKAFDVKVDSVRTLVCRTRWLKKQSRFGPPKYFKKAIFKLAKGQTISMFEGA